jgi:hypothetical protein
MIRMPIDILEEFVDRATHANRRELSMSVCHSSNTTKLLDIRKELGEEKGRMLTFSSIFAKGPPPPSPCPNTRSAVSEDSRFYSHCQMDLVLDIEITVHLMVSLALPDIANGCRRSVCVYRAGQMFELRTDQWSGLARLTDRCHMAQNLRSIDSHPIESGMGENIAG